MVQIKKTLEYKPFSDPKTGLKARIDEQGYLHIENMPILRSGFLKQNLRSVGYDLISLTEEDLARGWCIAYRSPAGLFSKSTLSKFVGIPFCLGGDFAVPYKKATAFGGPIEEGEEREDASNRPLGTLIEVHRGQGKLSDVLFGHLVVWNVHAFARQVVARYSHAIAPTIKLTNQGRHYKAAHIVQSKFNPNMLYLTHGDTYGFNILNKKTDFRKWLDKGIFKKVSPSKHPSIDKGSIPAPVSETKIPRQKKKCN